VIPFVKWFYLVALAVWTGGMVFFTAVVAPIVFKTLPSDEAAKLQRAIFPRYYLMGIVCAMLGVVCVGWLLAERSFGRWPGICSLLLLMLAGGTNGWLLGAALPRLNELRQRKTPVIGLGKLPEPRWEEEWKQLHRLSVQLNMALVAVALALLFLLVFARVA
jgi:hypothetical protein